MMAFIDFSEKNIQFMVKFSNLPVSERTKNVSHYLVGMILYGMILMGIANIT